MNIFQATPVINIWSPYDHDDDVDDDYDDDNDNLMISVGLEFKNFYKQANFPSCLKKGTFFRRLQ